MRRPARTFLVPLALALLLAALVAPAAGAAPGNGNSEAAKPCQDGGYANYTRADGTRFRNTGDCVSYAAGGGVLVALPDLRLDASCAPDASTHTVRCTFTVVNVGVGPAIGPLTLHAAMTGPVGSDLSLLAGFSGREGACPGGFVFSVIQETATDPDFQTVDLTCDGTLLPGEQFSSTVTLAAGAAVAGLPLTFAAAVDPGDVIGESNEANNTYTAIIPTP